MTIQLRKAPVGKVAQTAAINQHVLLIDVNQHDGGDDLAPDPHDLLDTALAACTALTLKLYAERKGWPLHNADVDMSHEESPGHYRLRRHIRLQGPLTEEQRQQLLVIANKCPIHRILSGEIAIETTLDA